jgi:hypothetical protein
MFVSIFTNPIPGLARSCVANMSGGRDVGTKAYLAPEMILEELGYGAGVDIWAMGCKETDIIKETDFRNKNMTFLFQGV